MHALESEPRVGYILGILAPSGKVGWISQAVLEPKIQLPRVIEGKERARVFGASENVGGLIFFLAAKGYRVIVERVGELA